VGIVEGVIAEPKLATDRDIGRTEEIRIAVVLHGHFGHAFIVIAVGIYHAEDDPDGLADILAAELHVGTELGVIGYTGRAPALEHAAHFVFHNAAVVITAVIDICGKYLGGPGV